MTINIPETTARRLPSYYRFFKNLLDKGKERVSSQEVSAALQLDPGTVRKDFSNLGEFGKRGYGYDVAYLAQLIGHAIHRDHPLQVVFIGSTDFYQVICGNQMIFDEGYDITAIFTQSALQAPSKFTLLPVYPFDDLATYVTAHHPDVAILAALGDVQNIAEIVVRTGINAILNYSTQTLCVPERISVQQVDIMGELHSLRLRKMYTH